MTRCSRSSGRALGLGERPELVLGLGRERLALRGDPRWCDLAAERYRDFLVAEPATIAVDFRVEGDRPPDPRELERGRQEPLRRLRSEPLRLAGRRFVAELERDGVRGTVSRVRIVGPLATYPLDLLLVALRYLSATPSLVVHAAALAGDEVSHLCTGPSGSGKSTLTELFPRAALCDELVAVEIADGVPSVIALPFWRGRPARLPLAGVHCLVHAPYDRRRPLGVEEAFARLARQVIWPRFDRGLVARCFETLTELVTRTRVWELGFRPRRDVWPLIADPEGRAPVRGTG